MTASEQAKAAGLKSLKQLSDLLWDANKVGNFFGPQAHRNRGLAVLEKNKVW